MNQNSYYFNNERNKIKLISIPNIQNIIRRKTRVKKNFLELNVNFRGKTSQINNSNIMNSECSLEINTKNNEYLNIISTEEENITMSNDNIDEEELVKQLSIDNRSAVSKNIYIENPIKEKTKLNFVDIIRKDNNNNLYKPKKTRRRTNESILSDYYKLKEEKVTSNTVILKKDEKTEDILNIDELLKHSSLKDKKTEEDSDNDYKNKGKKVLKNSDYSIYQNKRRFTNLFPNKLSRLDNIKLNNHREDIDFNSISKYNNNYNGSVNIIRNSAIDRISSFAQNGLNILNNQDLRKSIKKISRYSTDQNRLSYNNNLVDSLNNIVNDDRNKRYSLVNSSINNSNNMNDNLKKNNFLVNNMNDMNNINLNRHLSLSIPHKINSPFKNKIELNKINKYKNSLFQINENRNSMFNIDIKKLINSNNINSNYDNNTKICNYNESNVENISVNKEANSNSLNISNSTSSIINNNSNNSNNNHNHNDSNSNTNLKSIFKKINPRVSGVNINRKSIYTSGNINNLLTSNISLSSFNKKLKYEDYNYCHEQGNIYVDLVKLYENQRKSLSFNYLPDDYKQKKGFVNHKINQLGEYDLRLTVEEKERLVEFVDDKLKEQKSVLYDDYPFKTNNPFYNFKVNKLRNNIDDIYEKLRELDKYKMKVFKKESEETNKIIKRRIAFNNSSRMEAIKKLSQSTFSELRINSNGLNSASSSFQNGNSVEDTYRRRIRSDDEVVI